MTAHEDPILASCGLIRRAQDQHGVISRRELVAAGAAASTIDRLVRTGRWQRPLPGVLVPHSGPLPPMTMLCAVTTWAGVGAVLGPASSLFVWGVRPQMPRPVDVLIPWERRLDPRPGLAVSRRRHLRANRAAYPPVLRLESAILEQVGREPDADAMLGLLTDGIRRGSHVGKLRRSLLDEYPNLPHRALVLELLGDVAAGAESPLERRYHRDVERAHGLPRSQRQVTQTIAGLRLRADCLYSEFGIRVELDGRLAHPTGRTVQDCWRDNETGIARDLTLRYRWSHVLAPAACRTAAQVARALRSRGWVGQPSVCGPGCRVLS